MDAKAYEEISVNKVIYVFVKNYSTAFSPSETF